MDDELNDNFDIFEKDFECKIIMQSGSVATEDEDKEETKTVNADLVEPEEYLLENFFVKKKIEIDKEHKTTLDVDLQKQMEAVLREAADVDIVICDAVEEQKLNEVDEFLLNTNFVDYNDIDCSKNDTTLHEHSKLLSDFDDCLLNASDNKQNNPSPKLQSEFDSLCDSFFVCETQAKESLKDINSKTSQNLTTINAAKEGEYGLLLGDSFIEYDVSCTKVKEKIIEGSCEKGAKTEYDDILTDSFESASEKTLPQVQKDTEEKKSEYDHLLSDLFE